MDYVVSVAAGVGEEALSQEVRVPVDSLAGLEYPLGRAGMGAPVVSSCRSR